MVASELCAERCRGYVLFRFPATFTPIIPSDLNHSIRLLRTHVRPDRDDSDSNTSRRLKKPPCSLKPSSFGARICTPRIGTGFPHPYYACHYPSPYLPLFNTPPHLQLVCCTEITYLRQSFRQCDRITRICNTRFESPTTRFCLVRRASGRRRKSISFNHAPV